MKDKDHIRRHQELHKSLDELVADMISHKNGMLLSKTSVMELMEWSYSQVEKPTEVEQETRKEENGNESTE